MREKEIKINREKILKNGIPFSQIVQEENWSKEEWQRIKEEADYIRILEDLKEFKQKEQITNAEISRRTGITRPELTLIFNGKRNVTINTLSRIATAFNKSLRIKFV